MMMMMNKRGVGVGRWRHRFFGLITHIGASWSGKLTSQIRSRVEYLIPNW